MSGMLTTNSAAASLLRDNRVHRLATLWEVERKDGLVLRFTDHNRALLFEGNTYRPTGGASPSARQRKADVAQDNMEIIGVIDSEVITENDLAAGRYTGATIRELVVDWRFPSCGAISETLYEIASITFDGTQWNASIAGLTHRLRQLVGGAYSRLCRHDLGNAVCRVDLGALEVSGEVDAVTLDKVSFETDLTEANAYFEYGTLTWTSGLNDGIVSEVKTYLNASGVVELALETPYAIQVGDTFTAVPGCDKNVSTCRDKFDNVVNFGGFPQIPGTDRLYATPNSKQ